MTSLPFEKSVAGFANCLINCPVVKKFTQDDNRGDTKVV